MTVAHSQQQPSVKYVSGNWRPEKTTGNVCWRAHTGHTPVTTGNNKPLTAINSTSLTRASGCTWTVHVWPTNQGTRFTKLQHNITFETHENKQYPCTYLIVTGRRRWRPRRRRRSVIQFMNRNWNRLIRTYTSRAPPPRPVEKTHTNTRGRINKTYTDAHLTTHQ